MLIFELQPDRDYTVTKVQRALGDPFDPLCEVEILTLPEPVHLKAGERYEAGFDECGQPFVRPYAPDVQEVPE